MDFLNKIALSYIIVAATSNVFVDSNCIDVFNKCIFEITCENRFTLNGYMHYYRQNYAYDTSEYVDRNCKLISAVDDDGNDRNDFYPIHLSYKILPIMNTPTLKNDVIPRTSNDRYLALITSLDISNNNFEVMPNLQPMGYLDVLKLCDNSLTIAKLSNVNDFPLTEINFAHNTISDIQYDLEQYIYKNLKKIDLSYNYLTKITEAVFEPFHELECLDVSHNYIDTLTSFTFEGMKNLLYLNISYNRISDIESSLFRFNNLKQLDLSNNRIRTITTSDFKKLTNLENLNLNSNLIAVIEVDSFHNMPSLTSLYLNHNKLEYIDKNSFSNATQLENLDISNNHFKSLSKGLFKNKNIRNFIVDNNILEGSVVKGTFEGLSFVTSLDLSNQHLSIVEDYAFYGLNNIEVLLLNGNNIRSLSPKCFKTIKTLKTLDLSFNKIEHIEFEKDDLLNLFSLTLRKNLLTVVKKQDFHGLQFLQYLDLSDNKIMQVETNSFESLKELINFQISNNPLSGTLQESTFFGLNSLPSLDISHTLLSIVRNGSFIGMLQLKDLNVSHSKIQSLEYNTFVHTGAIELIDLSFNELKEFYINSTELVRLSSLYINNNFLQTLDSVTFQKLLNVVNLHLAYNEIQIIDTNIFINMKQLRLLDISYNLNLNFTILLLNKTNNIDALNLSGIKTKISFDNIKDVSLSQLTISNSSITDVKTLQINQLQHLDTLSLIYNGISKLEAGGFYNMSALKYLDVSFNKISFIQPGVFRDNVVLHTLNISHNLLADISYGIFRGPIYLQNLDISYNNIKDLQNERFYEVSSLSVLIADHNKIETINAQEFQGTSLSKLSIGDNPIPCEILVNLKRREGVPFLITAIKLDDNNDENVDGVTCNKKSHADRIVHTGTSNIPGVNEKILFNIRDILLDHFSNHQINRTDNTFPEKLIVNITDVIVKSTSDILIAVRNNETNILLDKILKVLKSNSATTMPPIQITKDNATYDNLVLYINRIKQQIEDSIKVDKNNRLDELEAKILEVNSRMNQILQPTEMPVNEKLIASTDTKSVFTEICVVLILVILVGFILFKVYKSRMYMRQRLSISTRELPGAMDSTL